MDVSLESIDGKKWACTKLCKKCAPKYLPKVMKVPINYHGQKLEMEYEWDAVAKEYKPKSLVMESTEVSSSGSQG